LSAGARRTSHGASAPGKLMVSGEYVVLDGAVALVAAADARAFVRWHVEEESPAIQSFGGVNPRPQGIASLPPEVIATRALAEARLGLASELEGDALRFDVSDLRRNGRKLGLGSSAAAAAATAGAVFARAGRDLNDASERVAMLAVAFAGHRSVAPEGSGADVAASVLGGLVRFQRDAASGEIVEATPVSLPRAAQVRVVWTGHEARTSVLVRQVKTLAATSPAAYARSMSTLAEAAARLADACTADDAGALVEAVAAHHAAMAALGEAAGAPIVEAGLSAAAVLARSFGGAAKPSGAGGGDVALAFFADRAAAEAFTRACPAAGLDPVDVALGAPGVRAESPADRL
jgi:phosphomevalonate kinase